MPLLIHWAQPASSKASGLGAEQSESIVEVVSQSTSQFVTVEHFDAGIESVRADFRAEIAGLRTEMWYSILVAVGVFIAANALMMTILGIVLTNGGIPVPP